MNLSELKRALEDGRCFRADFVNQIHWYFFVDEVGWCKTVTDPDGSDPHTGGAGDDDFRAAVKHAKLAEVDREEVP